MDLEGEFFQRAEIYFRKKGWKKAKHIKHWPVYEEISRKIHGRVLRYDERTFKNEDEFPPINPEHIETYDDVLKPEEEPSFPCPHCPEIFTSQEALDAHIETEHPSPPPPPPKLEIPVLGDYYCRGVRHGITGRTMIPQLMTALKQAGVRDYFHQVWNHSYQWDDFKLLVPECQKAGIRPWLYNVPPSEPPSPKPFEYNYIRWAEEVAQLMLQYPVVQGMIMDDFNGNHSYFTIAKTQQIVDAGRAVAPNFKFIPVGYMGHGSTGSFCRYLQAGLFDAVLLSYWWPWKDSTKTDGLRPQIEEYRAWIDGCSSGRRVPFIPFINAFIGHEGRPDPLPAYVQECLQICKKAYEDGLIEGMATYVLPKDNPEFIEAVASVYKGV